MDNFVYWFTIAGSICAFLLILLNMAEALQSWQERVPRLEIDPHAIQRELMVEDTHVSYLDTRDLWFKVTNIGRRDTTLTHSELQAISWRSSEINSSTDPHILPSQFTYTVELSGLQGDKFSQIYPRLLYREPDQQLNAAEPTIERSRRLPPGDTIFVGPFDYTRLMIDAYIAALPTISRTFDESVSKVGKMILEFRVWDADGRRYTCQEEPFDMPLIQKPSVKATFTPSDPSADTDIS